MPANDDWVNRQIAKLKKAKADGDEQQVNHYLKKLRSKGYNPKLKAGPPPQRISKSVPNMRRQRKPKKEYIPQDELSEAQLMYQRQQAMFGQKIRFPKPKGWKSKAERAQLAAQGMHYQAPQQWQAPQHQPGMYVPQGHLQHQVSVYPGPNLNGSPQYSPQPSVYSQMSVPAAGQRARAASAQQAQAKKEEDDLARAIRESMELEKARKSRDQFGYHRGDEVMPKVEVDEKMFFGEDKKGGDSDFDSGSESVEDFELSGEEYGDDEDEDEKCCAICMDKPKTHMCYPCGHRCVCGDCCKLGIDTCPICRKKVENIIKVFG